MKPRSVAALALALVVLAPAIRQVSGYALYSTRWADGSVVMHLQLGSFTGTLIDGSSSWGGAVEPALAEWNEYLDRVEFRVVRDSNAGINSNNGVNNVFWSSTIYGRSFEGYVAYCLTWIRGTATTEADVLFNRSESWNSYGGYPLRRSSSGGSLYDIRRVALHEFGHAIGLDHPNEHGQQVESVMNAPSHRWEHLMADDISAVQYLYSFGPGSVSFPPRNESLDFRNQLEAKYRDGLRRGNGVTYVDREGDIVWISEYYRYRVNACSHSQAQTRVFTQIDDEGTYGVCGAASSGAIAFPPRNEALSFRTALEAKYRDDLRRGATTSAVDNEGDVVWIQEYLRYRVNGCSHAVAVDKVFAQIDGRGVQPTCG